MTKAGSTPLLLPQPLRAPRRPKVPEALERWVRRVTAPVIVAGHNLRGRRHAMTARLARRHAEALEGLDDESFRRAAAEAGARLRHRRSSLAAFAEVAAFVSEAVRREKGFRLNPRQLQGGAVIWSGMIAEMETGEGKTLTAVLPAAAAALSGRRAHVITVNDYLAERDHDLTAAVYARLGIATALVVRSTPAEDRWRCYQAPVVYASNAELAFDHLRDRTETADGSSRVAAMVGIVGVRPARLPTLDFAVVDEVDSILIDEARTPLILSAEGPPIHDTATCARALDLARGLSPRGDYRIDSDRRRVILTARGQDHLADLAPTEGRWVSPVFREEIVRQALSALHLFHAGRDYLVTAEGVQIVDENTGRVFADRSWSMGLHQLIEVKEGLPASAERGSIGQLTYQSLFCRYATVGGMSGTVSEAASEFWQVYRIRTARVPTFRKSRRRHLADRIFTSEAQRTKALLDRIETLHRAGAPVLVGARTVEASEAISGLLTGRGLPHALLNASHDAEEAAIVALAGQAGRITVATNMAGRGTDIRPDPEALRAGGLHVLLTERHDSRRIDRQLQGRSARQGDPGQCEAWLSLEDRLLAPGRLGPVLRMGLALARALPFLRRPLLRAAQARLERAHAQARKKLLRSEGMLDRVLAFSGERE